MLPEKAGRGIEVVSHGTGVADDDGVIAAPPRLTGICKGSAARSECPRGSGFATVGDGRPAGRTTKMKATVLIVDEDRSVCEPLTKALRQEGYEALLAYDGVEAVGLYRRHLPEVVLLALNMKRQNGWDILEELSPLDPLTRPIIVISGFAEQLGPTVAACVGALLTEPPQGAPLALKAQPVVRRLVDEPAPKRRSWRRYGVLTRWMADDQRKHAGEGGPKASRALRSTKQNVTERRA